jgi:hypothetical protein
MPLQAAFQEERNLDQRLLKIAVLGFDAADPNATD